MAYSVKPSLGVKRDRYIIFILLSIAIFFIEENTLIIDRYYMTRFHELQLLLVYGWAQAQSIRKFGMFNIFSLVLVGFFIFAVGGVFHYYLSGDNILEFTGHGFGDFYFTNSEMQMSLMIYSLFIIIAYFGYSYFYRKTSSYEERISINEKDIFYLKVGKFLMWGFLAVEIYKGYLYFSSFSIDRVLIYLYGNMENPVPSWVRLMATFFEMGYAFILCSKPDKSVFKHYSLLFFVVLIPEILLGNRGMFGAFILFFLWYYARFYNPRPIKMKYILIFGVFMLLVFQYMEFQRTGKDMSQVTFSVTEFLKGQATSFYILPIYIQNSSSIQYYLYPFVLYPILGGFSGYTGQSLEVLKHKCGVGHQLMYTVSPNYYLNGGSFGSSNIVELYDLGLLGIIAGAIFLPIMLSFLEKQFAKSRLALFMSYSLLTHFVLSARGSFFPQLYGIVKLILFYFLIISFFNALNNEKVGYVRRYGSASSSRH